MRPTLRHTTLALALAFGAAAAPATPAQSASPLPRARAESVGMSSERLARIAPVMRRYVEQGEVAGVVTMVMRRGRLVAVDTAGWLDLEARTPMRSTAIFRIASMTKPVTSVAAMMLVEEGRLLLSDPVSKYIPAFERMTVYVAGDSAAGRAPSTVPARRRITVRDLLTHRAGITYGFAAGPVAAGYRAGGVSDGIVLTAGTLAEGVERVAAQPLVHEPGARWTYGLNTDVLGRVIEVASGMPLDRFFRERIFAPLKMHDTYFHVPDDKLARVAVPYTFAENRLRVMTDSQWLSNNTLLVGGRGWRGSPTYFSGGAGLFSTAGDYARFAQMLVNGGGLDGVRLLSPKTIELMAASATGDLTPAAPGAGTGFGLGFSVVTDLGASGQYGTAGTFGWGGAYGSAFWVDPKEELAAVMMIQLIPRRVPLGDVFRTLTYQAVVDAPTAPAPPPR